MKAQFTAQDKAWLDSMNRAFGAETVISRRQFIDEKSTIAQLESELNAAAADVRGIINRNALLNAEAKELRAARDELTGQRDHFIQKALHFQQKANDLEAAHELDAREIARLKQELATVSRPCERSVPFGWLWAMLVGFGVGVLVAVWR